MQHSQAARVFVQLPPHAFELRLQHLREPLRENGQGGQQGGGLKGDESVAIHLLQDDAEHGGESLLLLQNGVDLLAQRAIDLVGRGICFGQTTVEFGGSLR